MGRAAQAVDLRGGGGRRRARGAVPFLPHPSLAEEAFLRGAERFAARFTDAASPAYLFADGRRSDRRWPSSEPPSSASAPRAPFLPMFDAAGGAGGGGGGVRQLHDGGGGGGARVPETRRPSRRRARARSCPILASGHAPARAGRGTEPPRSLLPSAALPPPFSLLTPPPPPLSQAGSLVSDALDRFDAASESLKGAPSVDAARAALQEQLQRALYPPAGASSRRRSGDTLSAFRQKLAALKPTAEVEVELKGMVKEALDGFGETAKALLPPTTKWGYGYEKSAVAATLKEQAQAHVETLRVQGLYLPKEGRHKPIDIGVHWLLLEFGGDRLLNGEGGRPPSRRRPSRCACARRRATSPASSPTRSRWSSTARCSASERVSADGATDFLLKNLTET